MPGATLSTLCWCAGAVWAGVRASVVLPMAIIGTAWRSRVMAPRTCPPGLWRRWGAAGHGRLRTERAVRRTAHDRSLLSDGPRHWSWSSVWLLRGARRFANRARFMASSGRRRPRRRSLTGCSRSREISVRARRRRGCPVQRRRHRQRWHHIVGEVQDSPVRSRCSPVRPRLRDERAARRGACSR